ncbi:olfactory receptor 14A16-like [Pantherophis guttatus]|uniref:Olfactory receptor n=1 Tax=Pantherophis guttatus TaxID=94885 RepID=A0ABM3ZMQ7_PANGU|nr:olfactory receptor 14A16-like [Pantherophis guttatus]
MLNASDISTFILLGFSDQVDKNMLYFILYLVIYITSLIANVLIILVVSLHHSLHTPMYFFLINLSVTDLGSISVTMPKAMINAVLNSREISYSGCITQVFSLLFFGMSDFFLLTGMAYDRYVAICDPLHYETIMGRKTCLQLAAMAWISALLYSTLHTCGTFAISFCSNVLNDFFCDVSQLLKISCDDSYLIEVGFILFSIVGIACPCFSFIIVSYVKIFKSVFKIATFQRQNKAFSTCIPHLIVVSLFVSTASVNLLKPPSVSPSNVEIVITVLYSVVPSLINPIVYTMRNREIQVGLCSMLKSTITSRNQS